jgi:hypothetical protein
VLPIASFSGLGVATAVAPASVKVVPNVSWPTTLPPGSVTTLFVTVSDDRIAAAAGVASARTIASAQAGAAAQAQASEAAEAGASGHGVAIAGVGRVLRAARDRRDFAAMSGAG